MSTVKILTAQVASQGSAIVSIQSELSGLSASVADLVLLVKASMAAKATSVPSVPVLTLAELPLTGQNGQPSVAPVTVQTTIKKDKSDSTSVKTLCKANRAAFDRVAPWAKGLSNLAIATEIVEGRRKAPKGFKIGEKYTNFVLTGSW